MYTNIDWSKYGLAANYGLQAQTPQTKQTTTTVQTNYGTAAATPSTGYGAATSYGTAAATPSTNYGVPPSTYGAVAGGYNAANAYGGYGTAGGFGNAGTAGTGGYGNTGTGGYGNTGTGGYGNTGTGGYGTTGTGGYGITTPQTNYGVTGYGATNNTNYGGTPAQKPAQTPAQAPGINTYVSPLANPSIPKTANGAGVQTNGGKAAVNEGTNLFAYKDNDFRTNFNINNYADNQRSTFKDTLGGGYINQPATGANSYGTQAQYGAGPTAYTPQQTGQTPSYGNYKPSVIPTTQHQSNSNAVVPHTSNLDPKVKIVEQYTAPAALKPKIQIDNISTKSIQDIMNSNKDVDKQKLLDLSNLGKVVYSTSLSSSSSKQNYEQKIVELKRKNEQFVDTDFPADKSSIAPPHDLNNYRDISGWKRANQIFSNPELISDGIDSNDILQGNLGDCYLLSTISAIAENPKRIEKMFESTDTSQNGIYAVEIVWRGVARQVILDDFFAVDKKNELYFLKSKNKELWVCLLEKAWAKLHRNYHRLDGQLTKETLHDFTGAPVRSYRTNKEQDALWAKMVDSDKAGHIMTTGTEGEDVGGGDPLRKFGLVSGHAYTLIGAVNVALNNGQTVRLVQIRNPWGEFEWKGKWSDNDQAWSQVSQSEKKRIGFSVQDDGTFFLEYKEMLDYFDGVQICYYRDDYLYYGKDFRCSYSDSKFFQITVSQEGFYYFNISQLSIRFFDEDYQDNPNSHYSETKFCIMNSSGQIVQAYSGKKRDLYSCRYIDTPKSFPAGKYTAFVSVKWQKNATYNFGFGAYGPARLAINEISSSAAGKLPELVVPWEQNRYPQFDVELISII